MKTQSHSSAKRVLETQILKLLQDYEATYNKEVGCVILCRQLNLVKSITEPLDKVYISLAVKG